MTREMPPFFLRKSDGATVYATRDLAAAYHRFEKYDFASKVWHRCIEYREVESQFGQQVWVRM